MLRVDDVTLPTATRATGKGGKVYWWIFFNVVESLIIKVTFMSSFLQIFLFPTKPNIIIEPESEKRQLQLSSPVLSKPKNAYSKSILNRKSNNNNMLTSKSIIYRFSTSVTRLLHQNGFLTTQFRRKLGSVLDNDWVCPIERFLETPFLSMLYMTNIVFI